MEWKRAVEKVYEQIENVRKARKRTDLHLRPHHPQRGGCPGSGGKGSARCIETEEDLKSLPEGEGIVVIRSHGVSRHIYDILNARTV